ncbi:MAG: hypothetical protein AB2809_00865 [Candidatus Thiodiazotropha sp.]
MIRKWTLLIMIVFVAACSGKKPDRPQPIAKPTIGYEKGAPQCQCQLAERVTLNNSNNFGVTATWFVTIKNIDTGEETDDRNEDSVAAHGVTPIGCTRGDPDLTGEKNCQYHYSSHRVSQTVQTKAALRDMQGVSFEVADGREQRLAACETSCSSGRDCMRLGEAAQKLYLPLYEVYQSSVSEGKEIIRTEDVLAEYGLDGDAIECKRGDTTLAGRSFQNESISGEPCNISLFEAAIVTAGADLRTMAELADMHVEIPAKLAGRSETVDGKDMGVFSEDEVAPYVYFTGENADILQQYFGGRTQVMGVRGNRFLVSMQNGGCLSFPAP